jgi:hypothetical protein
MISFIMGRINVLEVILAVQMHTSFDQLAVFCDLTSTDKLVSIAFVLRTHPKQAIY